MHRSPPPKLDPLLEGLLDQIKDWKLVSCGELVRNQIPVTIPSSSSVEEAGLALMKHNVTSAPVIDIETQKCKGMFDFSDLVSYILLTLKKSPKDLEMQKILNYALSHEKVPVKYAMDLSRKNSLYTLLPESTLWNALDVFKQGVHRVCIVDGNGKLIGILSQSKVISFVAAVAHKFSELSFAKVKTLRELGVGSNRAITVDHNVSVMDALSLMSDKGISSLAVTAEGGVLIGNISMTDIKYMLLGSNRTWRGLLYGTCHDYIVQVRSVQGIEDGKDSFPYFDIHLHNTLEKAMNKLVATKAHRLWVVNESFAPIGILSLSDIVRLLVDTPLK